MLQSSFVGVSKGRIVNVPLIIAGKTLTQASLQPFSTPYLDLSGNGSAGARYYTDKVNFSTQLQDFVCKSIMFNYRPYYSLSDDTQLSVVELLAQTNALCVFNETTSQCINIAPSVSNFENFYDAVHAGNGNVLRTLFIQGCLPFYGAAQDNIDLTYFATAPNGAAILSLGKAQFQFCEFEQPSWYSSNVGSIAQIV